MLPWERKPLEDGWEEITAPVTYDRKEVWRKIRNDTPEKREA